MRKLGSTVRLIARLSFTAACFTAPLTATILLPGCADENDPKTWVKRLDDPAQRAPAIKRLSQFFEDTMTKANKNREAPEVKALLDDVVAPMTNQYTTGSLDDKTRKELMKSLADMRDPRTAPALAKAFNDYEPGKNDEDVKYAAQSVNGMAASGKTLDPSLVDALWTVFSKFKVSAAKSINLVTDLHDAVLAVKSPSFGPKAVERLSAPVDPKSVDSQRNEIQFWQLTSIQVIRDTKFVPGIKSLVKVLLTPEKKDLWATVDATLMHMPKEAEAALLTVLNGSDPDLAKLATSFGEDKTHIALAADALGWISRPAGRDAVFAALPSVDNDQNRQALAATIVKFPLNEKSLPLFRAAYDKIPATDTGIGTRGALAQASSQFYDPSLVDWLLKEINGAKGDSRTALQLPALEAAIKLMTPAQVRQVGDVVTKLDQEYSKVGNQTESGTIKLLKGMYDGSSQLVQKCAQDAACYTKVLDEPIPSGASGANTKAIKAAWMSVIYGQAAKDKTRADLVGKVDRVKNAGARLALVEAIDRLAPQGDAAAAGALEKMVEADRPSGDKMLAQADDSVVKVALRLRARAMP